MLLIKSHVLITMSEDKYHYHPFIYPTQGCDWAVRYPSCTTTTIRKINTIKLLNMDNVTVDKDL